MVLRGLEKIQRSAGKEPLLLDPSLTSRGYTRTTAASGCSDYAVMYEIYGAKNDEVEVAVLFLIGALVGLEKLASPKNPPRKNASLPSPEIIG